MWLRKVSCCSLQAFTKWKCAPDSHHGEFSQAGQKERRSATHKRLPYYVNVNRTSLDHLLLGRNADVDKSVE